MSAAAEKLKQQLERGQPIDIRGDGKAGGGLVLTMQAFGGALSERAGVDVQDWPFFSSARKGANVRAFLRVARGRVEATHQISAPDVALLMNEAAAEEVDFAEGTDHGLYVLNTESSPADAARRHKLAGTIVTVAGDKLGIAHLGRPLGNVALLAAMVRSTQLVQPAAARDSLAHTLEKRRLPARLVEANLAMYDAALEETRSIEIADTAGATRKKPPFAGYGTLPIGAQAALRSSVKNRTSGYGRPGVRIEFLDPTTKCNGCSLCVAQCPEGIIDFKPDPARGTIVYGAQFADFCKVCRECVAACPLDLFHEVAAVVRPEGAMTDA
jgi:2-oxoacid:acceptor oxidoreductase gamma subunit (pyruvate/2-ketoisovalerate family)